MNEISFIHVSDTHLGHQQFNLEERFKDFGQAFAEVVSYALAKKVDFVIMGGDFFHKRAINAQTLKQAMELLQPLKDAQIPVLAIEGNHDKAYYHDKNSWLKLLNSLGYLRLLQPDYSEGKINLDTWSAEKGGAITQVNDIRIIGLGYLGATTEQRLLEIADLIKPSEQFTIMLLHAAVNKLLNQDLGGVKKDILNKFQNSVDYLALGHIHARDEDGWFYNPGSLENCHIDEAKATREKGFYHVMITEKEKQVLYIPSHPRPIHLLTVDISGALNPSEVHQKVISAVKELKLENEDKPMVQVNLKGEIDFSALAIDTSSIAKEIKEDWFCLYAEVQNSANLPSDNEVCTDQVINRQEIEKQVFERLFTQFYPALRNSEGDFINMMIGIKNAATSGSSPEEILDILTSLTGLIPDKIENNNTDEVAAGGEDN